MKNNNINNKKYKEFKELHVTTEEFYILDDDNDNLVKPLINNSNSNSNNSNDSNNNNNLKKIKSNKEIEEQIEEFNDINKYYIIKKNISTNTDFLTFDKATNTENNINKNNRCPNIFDCSCIIS
jgi:hypothetical protein